MPAVEPVRPSAARRLRRGALALTAAGAAVAGLLLAPGAVAAPLDAAAPGTVTADGLPTVQINGVAWAQVVVGDTVYVAGSFTSARPAGAPLGTDEVPRENLLAYDIRTGELVQGFHHVLNNDATSIAASPDGSRIYVGGKFTSVDGVARYRLAAFDVATGNLVTTFKPIPSSAVTTVAVTADAVYFGGSFNNVNGVSRARAAAVNPAGAVLPWAPTIDNYGINALVVTPDRTGVVLGGRFNSVNGQPAFGSAAVDATTGATRPWALNQTIRGNNTAGTLTLATDGTLVYGGNYTYSNGNFEGTWAADPATGAIVWANDCLGDTYSATPINGVVYTATHAHNCAAAGYFPETNPRTWNWALAFDARQGSRNNTGPDAYGHDFSAYRTSEMMQWFPKLAGGSYTGQGQAAWSVAGNADYVVFGGEFPTVNGIGQQGLVRFAAHALAPNAFGPGAIGTPTATSRDNDATTSTVTVSATGAYDRDDARLTYELFRTGVSAAVATTTAPSTGFWTTQPTVTLVDPTAPRNATPSYRLVATDPGGKRSVQTVTVSTTTPPWVPQNGAVSSANGYQAAVGTTGLTGRTLTVPFTATGGWFLPRPDGSCLKSGATVVRPTPITLSTSQWGRYVGTATYALPASGSYGFQYGCRAEFSTPTIGVATLPAG